MVRDSKKKQKAMHVSNIARRQPHRKSHDHPALELLPTHHLQYSLNCQLQRVNPENRHISNIIQTEQTKFRNMYAYTYIHPITISEKEESRDVYLGLEGENGKG